MSCRFPLSCAAVVAALGVAASQPACGDGESLQGVREPCSNASGTLLGCDDMPIESPEDACWRLVECGVIPLQYELEDDDDWVLDWAICVRMIERMSEARYEFVLQCIETSSCDDLKVEYSPVEPRRGDLSIPLCLQFGDPP